jgi:hypothetical protein
MYSVQRFGWFASLLVLIAGSVHADEVSNWTGFYAGVNAGYGWSDNSTLYAGEPGNGPVTSHSIRSSPARLRSLRVRTRDIFPTAASSAVVSSATTGNLQDGSQALKRNFNPGCKAIFLQRGPMALAASTIASLRSKT